MAFGEWMKKITNGVKEFGNKIKNWANKHRDQIEKGLDTIGKIGETGLGIVGDITGNEKIKDVGQNIRKWTTGASERFIKPAYTMLNGPS